MNQDENEFEEFAENFWDDICIFEAVDNTCALEYSFWKEACSYLAEELVNRFGFHLEPWAYPNLIRNKWIGLLKHYEPSST